MGICGSSVPDVIIPDPEPGQKCDVLFKKTGMLARDQYVYQDKDKEKKWLLMDKEGGLFDNPIFILENFVRDDKGKGAVLCAAKLKVTDAKTYGREVEGGDSDSSEEDSSLEAGEEKDVEVAKMKWAQAVKVTFYSTREMADGDEIAVVKVKAKGKAKKTVTTITSTSEDEEGNEVENVSTNVDILKKCKKVKYTITMMKGEESPPSIVLEGKPDKNAEKLKWVSDVFSAEIDQKFGFGSDQIEVFTEWKHPGLGMLMGYIIAKEISPDDIKDNVSVW